MQAIKRTFREKAKEDSRTIPKTGISFNHSYKAHAIIRHLQSPTTHLDNADWPHSATITKSQEANPPAQSTFPQYV